MTKEHKTRTPLTRKLITELTYECDETDKNKDDQNLLEKLLTERQDLAEIHLHLDSSEINEVTKDNILCHIEKRNGEIDRAIGELIVEIADLTP